LSRAPWVISTAGPDVGNGSVDAEPAFVDGGSAVEVVDDVGDDATTEVAVAAPVPTGVGNGLAVGADAVSAACTALPQPANPAMATRNPAPNSDRRDNFIHTSSD
jgi:pantoate kinase